MTPIVVQAMTESMIPQVGELFERTYGQPFNRAFYSWRFFENPFGPTMTALAMDGSRIVSHYAACPAVMRTATGGLIQCAQSMTTMTDPDYAGRGLFPMLAEGLYRRIADEHRVQLVFGFPNANSHYAFVHKLGWDDVCQVSFLSRHIAEAGGEAEFVIGEWDELDACLEAHQSSAFGHQPYARTADFVHWRYRNNPEHGYLVIRSAGSPSTSAVVVAKIYSAKGKDSSLDIVDFLGDLNLRDVTSAIAAAIGFARSRSLDSIQGWVNLHHPAYPAFERLRFRPVGPITYFGIRQLGSAEPVLLDPRMWWITMGDSDVF